jgi:hypothetical protein
MVSECMTLSTIVNNLRLGYDTLGVNLEGPEDRIDLDSLISCLTKVRAKVTVYLIA